MTLKPTLAALLCAAVAACSSLPVGFGGTYKIVEADESGVWIHYDSSNGAFEPALEAARAHCKRFNKAAVHRPEKTRYRWTRDPETWFECR